MRSEKTRIIRPPRWGIMIFLLYALLFAFAGMNEVKGQVLRAGGGDSPDDPFKYDIGHVGFGYKSERYLSGITSGQLYVVYDANYSNRYYTFNISGTNTMSGTAIRDGNTSSAIDLGVNNNWAAVDNTLTITPYSGYPTLTVKGAYAQGYAVMSGIGTARGRVRFLGSIWVEATGAATANGIDGVVAPGIGGYCRDGSENQVESRPYGWGSDAGTLGLASGARVRMTEQASSYNNGQTKFNDHLLPKVEVEDYATFWIQAWNLYGGQPSGTNMAWSSTRIKKLNKISGDHIVADFTGYYTTVPSGWKTLTIPYSSGTNINGQLYVEYTPKFEFFVKSRQRQYINYFTIADIPSGPIDGNETAQMGYIGAQGTAGNVAYYPSFAQWNTSGSNNQTLTLNSTKYPATGQLTAKGTTVFNGNNNVAIPREFKTGTGGITFDATNTNSLELKNLTVNSGSTITVKGHVFMGLAAANGNQITDGVMKDQDGMTSIYHYQTSLSATNLTVEGITYDGVKVNNYHQNGATIYLWLPVKSNKVLTITAKDGSNNTIVHYNNSLSAETKHGESFLVSRAIATIGSVYYSNLTDAFAAATNNQIITLIDNYIPTGEIAKLSVGVNATFDLARFSLAGTPTLDANGGRLLLKGTSGSGRLTGTTTLAGMVFADATFTDLGTIRRPGASSEFVRYFAEKLLINPAGEVCYSWGTGNDKSYFINNQACLWIPKNMTGRVDFGYSADMAKDKCGEILTPTGTGSHGNGATTVAPYLPIHKTKVKIETDSFGGLTITHNGVSVSNFILSQPITVYGTASNTNNIEVNTSVDNLIIHNLSITHPATATQAPIHIAGGTLKLFLSGENSLKGGGALNNVKAGIEVANVATVEINSEQTTGTGRLYAQGGAFGAQSGAGIGGGHGVVPGTIKILGGTIRAEGGLSSHWGIGNGLGAGNSYGTIRIHSGSVNTRREWSGATLKQTIQNSKSTDVYLVTINTGLSKNTLYECTYFDSSPELFRVTTDENSQCFFWLPKRTLEQNPVATFRDPNTGTTVTIPLVQILENDDNVAPIVCKLDVEGGFSKTYNSLLDAFEAVPSATGTKATITMLANVSNLSTLQMVKIGTSVTLDLDRFNIDTQNSNTAGFQAANGGYLYITGNGASGTGNIRSSFRVGGDVFVNQKVPLTDAATSSIQTRGAVYRTLLSGLSKSGSYSYTYSFGNSQVNQSFQVHDGLACLWLPGITEVLTVKESNGTNITEYTAGTQTTNVHSTDAIEVVPIGVVAQLIRASGTIVNYKTLEEAFKAAAAEAGSTVQLKSNVALTASYTLENGANFTFDLRGMSLTTSSAIVGITVPTGASLLIEDTSVGVNKNQLQCNWVADGNLFVASGVTMNNASAVTRNGSTDKLHRVIAGVGNLNPIPTTLSLDSKTSVVHANEACFWKKAEGNIAQLTFTDNGGTTYDITNVSINTDHQDNMFTLGVTSHVAHNVEQDMNYDTFAKAWAAAKDGERIELLKDASVETGLSLTSKTVTIDLMRYNLTQINQGRITVDNGAILVMLSSNKNSRMQVPVKINGGNLYLDSSIQGERLTGTITNSSNETLWRALVENLPQGMPNGAVFNYVYNMQTGSFYVLNNLACLWLKKEDAQTLTFDSFGTTDNVTVADNHGNLITWGQNNVAQVNGNLYATLDKAFSDNSNAKVVLLKTAVFSGTGGSSTIGSDMQLEMGGNNVIPKENTTQYSITENGSLKIMGKGSITTLFDISFANPMSGSNANLYVEPNVSLGSAQIQSQSVTYFRSSITFPKEVSGVMTYAYGSETGTATVLKDQPFIFWVHTANTPNDLRFTQGANIYLASSVNISATHVNPVNVYPLTDEVHILGQGGGKTYYSTLAAAFGTVVADQKIMMERDATADAAMTATALTSGQAIIDLQTHTLTAGKATSFTIKNSSRMVLTNGTMSGFLKIAGGDLFVEGSVDISTLRVSDAASKSVWRTLLTLPAGTTSFSYKLGNSSETSTNIQTINGNQVACLWIPSSNQAQDFIVTIGGTEYALKNVIIASTHGNELDLTNTDPVASVEMNNYASLASAFASVADNGTVMLLKDLVLSSVQSVRDKNVTLNLNKKSITSANGGFLVGGTDKKLTIKDGILSGSFRISGDLQTVDMEESVSLSGSVLDKDNKAVYRGLIKAGTDSNAPVTCHWLYPNSRIYDYELISNGDTYEATIPINFTDHNTKQTAYKRVELTNNSVNWNSAYENTNLVLSNNVVLTAQTATTLHRLTIHDGARVITTPGTNVIATEGIHYKRTFATADKWESIALPFTATRIEEIDQTDKTKVTPLSPATGSGTAGYFWLTTVDNAGSLKDVTSSEMTANVGYLMAVPSNLENKEITFVSGENQLLNRNARVGVQPVSGFASYANEALDDLTLTTACYVLDDNGQDFVRIQSSAYLKTSIPPFRGYLFADPVTTAITSVFRAGNVPTATETPSLLSDLRITAGKGYVILESERAHQIAIYSFTGRCIGAFSFAGGWMQVKLTEGLYIVNGKKIFVKQ